MRHVRCLALRCKCSAVLYAPPYTASLADTFFFHELISLCVEISHTMWLMAKGKRADLTLLQFDTVTLDRLPAAINKTFSHPVLTVAQMRARMAKHLGVRVDEFA